MNQCWGSSEALAVQLALNFLDWCQRVFLARGVSPFHLSPGCIHAAGFAFCFVVGLVLVGFCLLGLHLVFFARHLPWANRASSSLDHRRLDDRQSLGARTAWAQKKSSLLFRPSFMCGFFQFSLCASLRCFVRVLHRPFLMCCRLSSSAVFASVVLCQFAV